MQGVKQWGEGDSQRWSRGEWGIPRMLGMEQWDDGDAQDRAMGYARPPRDEAGWYGRPQGWWGWSKRVARSPRVQGTEGCGDGDSQGHQVQSKGMMGTARDGATGEAKNLPEMQRTPQGCRGEVTGAPRDMASSSGAAGTPREHFGMSSTKQRGHWGPSGTSSPLSWLPLCQPHSLPPSA